MGSSTLLPALLETLFGYDAYHAGLVLSPSGFFAVAAVIVGGRLISKGFDARFLIGSGLLIVGLGSWWMSRMNLEISPTQVMGPRIVLIIGLSLIFAPINVAAFLYIPREMRGAAVGLFALLRNEGGSFGASFGKIVTERREQMHVLHLNENLDPLNPAVTAFTGQAHDAFLSHTGDHVAASQMALQSLEIVRNQQALSLAYFDVFLIFAVGAVVLALFVPLMRKSVVKPGQHVSAE